MPSYGDIGHHGKDAEGITRDCRWAENLVVVSYDNRRLVAT